MVLFFFSATSGYYACKLSPTLLCRFPARIAAATLTRGSHMHAASAVCMGHIGLLSVYSGEKPGWATCPIVSNEHVVAVSTWI